MRNPLLIFFSGYNLSRYFIRLKFPRDIAVIAALKRESSVQAGACQWRGLHSAWNLTGDAMTLLDFSNVKRYRLGFDTTLVELKSHVALKRFKRICFDISSKSFFGKHTFNGFFFNLGAYNSTSNHNLVLWEGIYAQLIKLSAIFHRRRLALGGGSLGSVRGDFYLPWKPLYSHDTLVWALEVSSKLPQIRKSSYLDEASSESYLLNFSETAPWAKLPTMQPFTDIFLLGCHDPIYVLPEFYGGREVILSLANSDTSASESIFFSSFNLAKLMEDAFFSSCESVTLVYPTSGGEWYRVFLLYCVLSGVD